MVVPLMRDDLRCLYDRATQGLDAHPHPGLLLQRGLPEHDEGNGEARTRHIKRVCEATPGKFYRNAFERWRKTTSDEQRFRQVRLELENRLFIGLTGGGMLETGCAISHSHGAPCIPGSSVKGAVAAFARERLEAESHGPAICDELFGAPAAENRPAGLSGLITFHDAWWAPGSTRASTPLVQEVVTNHHSDYYRTGGATPATDFDRPVPNAQVAVQGEFLFVIEGPVEWLDMVESMLVEALVQRGLGARTRSGYGLFKNRDPVAATRSGWVDETISRLTRENNARQDDILRGRGLAEAFQALADPELKREAFEDIRARWQQKGWWDGTGLGRAARIAKRIYDDYAGAA